MKKKINRVIAVIFSIIFLMGSFFVNVYAETPDTEILVECASKIIFKNEGNYTSVNPNDCGALSIGKVQWHAVRALNLLKDIIALNEANAIKILGDKLFKEITTTTSDWNNRTLNDSEKKVISQLLGTPEGKKAQDTLANKDIESYIKHGKFLGITDGKALVYFADLENQCGYGGVARIASIAVVITKAYNLITLDILHKAALDYLSESTHSRRNAAFNDCDKLVFSERSNSAIYNVNLSNITGKGCTITFNATKDVESAKLFIWSETGDYSASYDIKISNLTGNVDFTVDESKIKGSLSQIKFGAKIIGFKKGQQDPFANYEGISFTLKPQYGKKGDVDGDTEISVKDAKLILRHCARLDTIPKEAVTYADVNGDGKITTSDAKLILKAVAKLINL